MKKILFTTIILLASFTMTKAQVSSLPFAQSMDTYQEITGTIADFPFADDIYVDSLPIGFNFTYNGNVINKFGVSSNGCIGLGYVGNFTAYSPINGVNAVYAFNGDLMNNNAGGNIQYVTLGVAPNRVLIVQWKNYAIYSGAWAHLNFQIRLLESSNCIQLYYGTNSRGPFGAINTFFVGLTSNAMGDYNLRNTTSDWTNTSPVLSFPGTGCHFDTISNLPNGLVYSFGTCPVAGTAFSFLTGKVYNDANNNGVQDTGENGLANVLIHETTQNYNVNTDTSGNYSLFYFDSTLNYTISCAPFTYWTQTSAPLTYSVIPASQPTNSLDFGLYGTPNVHEVGITTVSTNTTYPYSVSNFYTTYHNSGTVVESDTIKFTMDSLFSFVSATPAPASVSGNNVYWLYSNLNLNEYRTISMQLLAASTVVYGDTLNSRWLIQPYASDIAPGNNTYIKHQAAFSSWDPNAKTVVPEGTISITQQLEYTINFQNTGTAPASYVSIHDSLDTNLDITTFNVIGYSHPMTYSITGQGNVIFSFANINLPDSTTNEPGSHGYVRYTISPKTTALSGTHIYNTGAIYFDANLPVITNTTQNLIGSSATVGIATVAVHDNFIISPNPFSSQTTISFSEEQKNTTIKVMNVLGEEILKQVQNDKVAILDMSGFAKGIYFVRIESFDKLRMTPIVVNRKIVVE